MQSHSFIQESPIYQEPKVMRETKNRAVFRMVIQTADEPNRNKRIYPKQVLNKAMKQCEDKIKSRCFFGELDHPIPQGNDTFDSMRQTTVLLTEASHIIREYEWDKNKLIAEIETLTTPKGNILLNLIKDKTGLGQSMRGMAELLKDKDFSIVSDPLVIISYDAVSYPSHSQAVVDLNEVSFSESFIQENQSLVCLGGKCYLPDYFAKLIEKNIIHLTRGKKRKK